MEKIVRDNMLYHPSTAKFRCVRSKSEHVDFLVDQIQKSSSELEERIAFHVLMILESSLFDEDEREDHKIDIENHAADLLQMCDDLAILSRSLSVHYRSFGDSVYYWLDQNGYNERNIRVEQGARAQNEGTYIGGLVMDNDK